MSGPESVNQILNGKEYNYGIRIRKVIFEALKRAKLDVFEEWVQKEKKSNILTNFLECEAFTELIKKRESTMFNIGLQSISALLNTYDEFEIKICNGDSMFWERFLDMVQILLDFVKSICLPDCNLHLQSTERMLIWIHAYDRINYAKHFSYYWCSQQKIQNKFPAIYQQFQRGNFSTLRTKGKCNMLPPDQVIEQTINKDKKEPGGIIGISTSQGTMQRWVLSSHNTATLIADLRKSLNLGIGDSTAKDLSSKQIRFDENAVKKCYQLINSWTNPFTKTSNTSCLSSKLMPCYEVQYDLLEAQKIGKLCLDIFITERIETSNIDFYAPIKKICLHTFEKKKKKNR